MEKIRIKLKSFDPAILDRFARQIVLAARAAGAKVIGPIPLPTERSTFAVIRGPHVHKRGQEHFWLKKHKRLIEIHITGDEEEFKRRFNDIEVPPGLDIILIRLEG